MAESDQTKPKTKLDRIKQKPHKPPPFSELGDAKQRSNPKMEISAKYKRKITNGKQNINEK
ncbi:MAG: hypothetical protein FWE54_04855 [Methanimicrococcus sp.]|nr:hypothetical protein [Methanimicrococcus sp.]